MRFLVIGGTVFVGRAFVEAALSAGHEVTIFHRGQHGNGLFPGATEILGDRDGGLDVLGDGTWDAVVDTCGYVPRIVNQSVFALKGRVKTYMFISTISVYAEPLPPNLDEHTPRAILADPTVEEVTGDTYGGLKALCEDAVWAEFGDHSLIIRPGLIAGPHDPTNRFTYWVTRMVQGGEVLVSDKPDQPLQVIDVRDLAAFMLRALENGLTGSYNASGAQTTMGAAIAACHALNPSAVLVAVSAELLTKHEIVHWVELPLSLGDTGPEMMLASSDRAIQDGLTYHSIEDTIQATLAWAQSIPKDENPRCGLPPAKEAAILAEHHALAVSLA